MSQLGFIDVAPEPVGMGAVPAVILFVLAFVALLLGALVFFLWYRKRGLRGVEMIRPDNSLSPAKPVQVNNPNQL